MKKNKDNILKSSFFLKLFGIPYGAWFLLSLIAMIPDETETNQLTWDNYLIADIALLLVWFIISFVIAIIVNEIKKRPKVINQIHYMNTSDKKNIEKDEKILKTKKIEKKKNSLFGIIFTIISNTCFVLCFLISFVLMFKFDEPDIISEEKFITYMENKGCTIINQKEDSSDFETYLITDNKTCPYLVSYSVFSNEEAKKYFFSTLISDIFNNNTNVTGSNRTNIFSYYEYSTSGDFYKAATLNKNTILYVSVDKEYRNEMINLFKYFNYLFEPNWNVEKMIWLSFIFLLIICFVSMWGIEKKIRNKGWIALIPFYNIWILSKDILGSSFYSLLLLVPVGNVIFMMILYYNMGKVFNNNYSILLMFFPSIFWPLLAFDNSKYDSSMVMKKKFKSHSR